ncbi:MULTISPECIES: GNAT family N-acetyltransferase [unclassified Pseudomonas]|nr:MULTISPECIES: GNAT family N-acetyltransferase [unclassified Pseudomonas]WPX54801.1 GNAT family N-acetyltransferase [Pseudomonas sp. CCI4.2]WPX62260.1 GNAT family N-acetyltransferase [Pseudomonas sp. MH10]
MTASHITIDRASKTDLQGIVELQHANQLAQGGTLAAELAPHQIEEMMQDMPQIIARRNAEIVAFLMTTSQAVNKKRPIPVVEKTLQAYPYAESDAYIYGPICVSDEERGNGLAQLMFEKLLEEEPGRQGVLFIRGDNEPSLRAHKKMGMNKVGEFDLNGAVFHVFAYTAKARLRRS